ncbi:DUF4129 domain-containing protein [Microbacterium karelineae]|uniref:DUF4129 domain-containing protein n=1 Tax=Microbacterium karelineae TaxID=2654283 RepID=UPI0012EAAE9F|nr:DUF4129 domain-containing protein [Microbacterium karelineae]
MGADPDTTTRKRRGPPHLAGLVGACFAVVILAAAWQGRPLLSPPSFEIEREIEPPAPTPGGPTAFPEGDGEALFDLSELFGPGTPLRIILLALLALGAVILVAMIVRRLLRLRSRARRDGVAVDAIGSGAEPAQAVSAPVIRRGIDGALARIESASAPGDAIISAWIGLEETAEDAGRARGAAETPGEFAARILGERAGAHDDLRRLLDLYERVRFGAYEATAADRAAARESLMRVREAWT